MRALQAHGYSVQLVPLKTTGDIDLVSPIYAMGVTGVFTRELDTALLSGRAELAVHSLKDVPTVLPKGLRIAAVLERASVDDILVRKPDFDPAKQSTARIATSSIRRRSQWLHRYPTHEMVNVRGNVATRLKKFSNEGWDGIIFAKAGLERLGILPDKHIVLDWMTPAPAQGAIAIVCRDDDQTAQRACQTINHEDSLVRVSIERDFLFHLEGGCSVPISAVAFIDHDQIQFTGAVHSLDGKEEMRITVAGDRAKAASISRSAAEQIRSSEKGKSILKEFRSLNRNPEA